MAWRRWLGTVELLALGLWVGALAFWGGIGAPTAFRVLEREAAGAYVRAVFPRYYTVGLVLGALAFGTGVAGRILRKDQRLLSWATLLMVLMMILATSFARTYVLPRMEELRVVQQQAAPGSAEYQEAKAYFEGSHRASVALNAITLVTGLVAFLLIPVSRSERTHPGG
ncbi:MAG: hypothetical protein KatS3mg115_2076 [Candidatus Poribacteria bacterium]|nr:MAG: hypothetical protein KatS3mg115_2076 [Candidatus Poribacteria bacterium]